MQWRSGGGGGHGGGVFGESPPSHHVGWLMGATPPELNGLYGSSPLYGSAGSGGAGSAKQRSSGSILGSSPRIGGSGGPPLGSSYLGGSAPLGKFQHPSHALLENHGFKQIVYKKYYKRCLDERAQKGEKAAVGGLMAGGGGRGGGMGGVILALRMPIKVL
jgi:la-related protein 1